MDEFKCKKCGRTFKSNAGLKTHERTCKIAVIEEETFFQPEVTIEERIALRDEVKYYCTICGEVFATEEELDVHYLICRKDVADIIDKDEEIRTFFRNLAGRTATTRNAYDRMIIWFRHAYPKSEVNFDYSCSTCVNTLFRRLKDYYQKIK